MVPPISPARARNWAPRSGRNRCEFRGAQNDVTDGLVEFDERRLPLNLHGEGLALKMTYDSKTPSYQGDIASQRVRMLAGGLAPIELGVSAQFALEKSRIVFSALQVGAGESRADLTGVLENLRAPRGSFKVKASGTLRELVKLFPIPLEPVGTAAFDGNLLVNFAGGGDLDIQGRAEARDIGYAKDGVKISGAEMQAGFRLREDRIELSAIQANALGAQFGGSATLNHWRQVHIEGELHDLSVEQAARTVTDRAMLWNGTLAGVVELTATIGERDVEARANLAVSPTAREPR